MTDGTALEERVWPNINTLWASVFVDELARCGLRTAVISPGSRSTPLVMAFAEHPDIDDVSIIDERSAAFFGLGVARATSRPVALVCTSGTAAANYFPAICEANADDVPLVALTADRPVDRRESGASQSMDQTRLYGRHARWFHDLGSPELDARRLRALRSTCGLAWRHATTPTPGPIQINIPFRKPLEPVAVPNGHRDAVPEELSGQLRDAIAGRADGRAFSPFSRPVLHPRDADVQRLADTLLTARRPLILAGASGHDVTYADELQHLASSVGAPVLAEPTSGLRYTGAARPAILGSGDILLHSDIAEEIGEPDLVLQLGKPPLHWSARRLVQRLEGLEYVAVAPEGRRLDPEHHPTWFLEADPHRLIHETLNVLRARGTSLSESRWLDAYKVADEAARVALETSMAKSGELHEARVWRELGRALPDGSALFVSNSMPIRHFDTFLPSRTQRLRPFFNRGLNGIDGVLSTGLGVAHARSTPTPDGTHRSNTVIVTGDVAFRHDIGALAAAGRLGIDATIVVCDNGGGAIFEKLPISDFEGAFDKHFLTPPGIEPTSGLSGAQVAEVESWADFGRHIERATAEPGMDVIWLRTDRTDDERLRKMHVERASRAAHEALDGYGAASNRHQTSAGASSIPVVALHGFSGAPDDWLEHRAAFPNRELIALALPGHTAHPRMDDIETLRAALHDIVERIDLRGHDRVHLVGYSMGGRIALALAIEYPERIASLSLIGAHPGIRDEDERHERAEWDDQMAQSIQSGGLHDFVDDWMAHPVLASQLELDHERVVDARQTRLQHMSRGLAAAFSKLGTGRQEPLWDAQTWSETPVLYLAGAEDSKYVDIGNELAACMPSARFVAIEGAGHNALREQPASTLAAIRRHIERADS